MLIDFLDRLDDGRVIWVEATQFSSPDPSVGYGGWVEDMKVTLDGTGFPVSLTEAEENRLGNKCMDIWGESIGCDDYLD